MAQAVEPVSEGRPPPGGELEPLAVKVQRKRGQNRPKDRAVYPLRFLLGYSVVVLLFAAALGGVAILWGERTTDDGGGPAWSQFQPTGTEAEMTRQIAQYVAGRYRFNGEALARVIGGPPALQNNVPVSNFRFRSEGQPSETIGADKATMYILCGAGEECVLPAAAAAAEPQRLLRRQALELALYTLRYTGGDPVVALLPPTPERPSAAVFLRRDELTRQLEAPIADTLPGRLPPPAGQMGNLERATIDFLTLSRMYTYDFTQAADGTAEMVLDRVPVG